MTSDSETLWAISQDWLPIEWVMVSISDYEELPWWRKLFTPKPPKFWDVTDWNHMREHCFLSPAKNWVYRDGPFTEVIPYYPTFARPSRRR